MNLLRHETVRNLVAIYVPSLIMSFGQGLVIPTIPRLAAVFDVTPGMAAQVVTAVSLGRLFSTLPTGMFVDRFGTRPSMVLGALALTVLSVLTAVAPAFWVVLAAQFGSGAAVGLWQAGREISAVNLVRPDQRGRLMAGFFGLTSLGIAIGPVVGGLATEVSGYQAAFLLYAGVGAGVLCISAFVKNVRPAARPAGEPFLNFGSVNEVEPRYRSTFAVVIFGTFVDSLYRTMTNSLLPLYVVTQRGFSSADLGALFGIIGLMNVAFIVPTGFISDKLGRKAASVPSAALMAASFFLFPLADSFNWLAVGCLILASGAGLGNGSKASYSYDVIPVHARGRLQAMRRTLGELGALSGPLVGGIIADLLYPGAAFWAFAPLQVASTLLFIFVAKETMGRRRERVG